MCGLPPEFCEFNSKKVFNKCKPWLIKNLPDLYPYLKGTLHSFAFGLYSSPARPLTTRAPRLVVSRGGGEKEKEGQATQRCVVVARARACVCVRCRRNVFFS